MTEEQDSGHGRWKIDIDDFDDCLRFASRMKDGTYHACFCIQPYPDEAPETEV